MTGAAPAAPAAPRRPARVRAPELVGAGGWLGTDGPLTLRGLRGRFVLLDFWTSCCVNCLHVLDELRPLEERFPDELVVIGVHSPKFPHEADHATLADAVERYEVRHPVLDDPELATWSLYAVRAWPTLVLVDPEGYVVHTASGEGHGEGLGRLLTELVAEHDARGTLRRGGPAYAPPQVSDTALRFPGGLARLADGRLAVADTAHHAVVVLDADGERELARVGTGERGLVDGPAPRFAEPQGLCPLPDGRLLVADTANHVLRVVDLARGTATTVAGTGEVWRPGLPTDGPAQQVALSTPWDVCWWRDRAVVAMAGTHQLWAYDPAAGTVRVLAGTTGEGLRDGDARSAYLAQPSGLAPADDRVWFADAETSALRWYAEDGDGRGEVGTAVGTGLFAFGHLDGPAADALLQHPLGVCLLPDGAVAVLDTYNDAVRRYDPATGEVTTVATGVREPSAAVVDGDDLLVVASAAHRVERVSLAASRVAQQPPAPARPVTDLGPDVVLSVRFAPPPGQALDEREGPATRLVVTATDGLLVEGDGTGTDLARTLRLARGGQGVLHVAATAASCDRVGEHPACHLSRQDWGIPVRVVEGGETALDLVLNGQ